jgi:hypothetical protein
MATTISTSPTPSTSTDDRFIGEVSKVLQVQDILAERTTVSGDNELLVVWKTSWIPASSLAGCSAMRRWEKATKWASCDACDNAAMQIFLPVQPGSEMEADLARVAMLKAVVDRLDRAAAARGSSCAVDRPSKTSRCEAACDAEEAEETVMTPFLCANSKRT